MSTSSTSLPRRSPGSSPATIKTWDDPAIKADNPDAKLPSTKIAPVHRSDESGTTKNFTDYLEKAGEGALEVPGRQGVADQVR